MTFTAGIMVGFSICFLWVVASCLTAFWWHLVRAKEDQAFEDNHNYRPHREGNVVDFRRR